MTPTIVVAADSPEMAERLFKIAVDVSMNSGGSDVEIHQFGEIIKLSPLEVSATAEDPSGSLVR